uniref:FAR1 domain-containing protein n=1 Tax=Caenorhabditis tropicalis TaxID=1561998 RepID=A0A1I7TZW0_9PELO
MRDHDDPLTHLPVIPESVEGSSQDDSDSEESEFGELSSLEFTSPSYISFGEPVFSSNIIVNQPNCSDPSVMASSQNFNTFNYPVFKKYGYYINGVYYTMVKKGSTRERVKCLYRRGIPRLETIKEEPEDENEQRIENKAATAETDEERVK